MINSGISSLASANVVSPFATVAKSAVGLENDQAKEEPLPPVEQAAADSAPFNHDNRSDDSDSLELQAQQQQIRALASREREVIAHEQAHAAVGGQFAGAPSFSYERGPDGVSYAVAGEVSISLPNGSDPAATLAAARQVRSAALAPANPSSQDRRVAAQASQIETQAIADLAALKVEQQTVEQAQDEQARLEASRDQQAREQEQSQQQASEARSDVQEQSARRSAAINEQLITLDNIQRDNNVGSVVDQLA
jgi:acyl-CoA synthetase (AMP-forming)/AMP-acid ligase II